MRVVDNGVGVVVVVDDDDYVVDVVDVVDVAAVETFVVDFERKSLLQTETMELFQTINIPYSNQCRYLAGRWESNKNETRSWMLIQ